MSKRTVKFEFDVNNKVKTKFSKGIITMIAVDSSGKHYYVENTVQGVVNKWFRASDLKLRS